MATSTEYEQWLRANQSKRGTADYATVLRAFENALQREAAQAAPAAPAAKPESGFFPALRSGATELGGGISALLGKLGLKDEATAQAEFDAAQKRAKEIFAPTEAGWTEAPVAKTLELLGGSIPYMAAPLAAGAAAAALPLTGTLAVGTALGAAGLTSAAQFTATNLSRQMEEGKKLADTDLGNAALAAVPMALLDTAAMRLIPGIGRIFGQAGIKVTPETAKEIAEQALKKTLIDYTAATGKTMGVEGLTEATQQVLERAQAGLSLTDPKARDEYFDSFIGGAVLGGTLAVPGRYLERSDAQGKARELLGAQEAEKRKAEREAEEAKKKSPEYLLDLEARYKAAVAKKAELDAAAAKKPPAGADPAAMIAYRDAVRERDAFAKKEMAEVSREYVTREKDIAALKEQQRVAGMTPLEYQMEQAGVDLKTPVEQRVFTGEETFAPREKVAPAPEYAASRIALANEQRYAEGMDPKDRAGVYAEYLMGSVPTARQLVAANEPIPGVSASVSRSVLAQLKLRLKAYDAAQAAKRQGSPIAQLEAEEAAALEDTARAEEARLAETEERKRLAPEITALQRMAARRLPESVQEDPYLQTVIERAARATPPEKQPSSAVGQMQQILTGQDVTYTAEEPKAPAEPRRVKGTGEFRLYSPPSEEVEGRPSTTTPLTAKDLETRLASSLAREDLPQDVYEMLRRIERTLPSQDTTVGLEEQKLKPLKFVTPSGKPISPETKAESKSYYGLVDALLKQVEATQPAEGAPRRVTSTTGLSRAFTAEPTTATEEDLTLAEARQQRFADNLRSGMSRGDAAKEAYDYARERAERATKKGAKPATAERLGAEYEAEVRAGQAVAPGVARRLNAPVTAVRGRSAMGPDTLRGPSAATPEFELDIPQELRLAVASFEQARADTDGQLPLFPEGPEKGFILETPEAFTKFLEGKDRPKTMLRREQEMLETARAALVSLKQEIAAKEKAIKDLAAAKDRLAASRALVKTNQELATLIKKGETLRITTPLSISYIPNAKPALTQAAIDKMDVDERIRRIEEVRGARARVLNAANISGEDKVLLLEIAQVYATELQAAETERTALLAKADYLLQAAAVEKALNDVAQLSGKPGANAQIATLEQELVLARAALSAAGRTVSRADAAAAAQAAKAQREREAVNRGLAEAERTKRYVAQQAALERLEAAPGGRSVAGAGIPGSARFAPTQELGATVYPALTEAQRLSREQPEPRITLVEQKQLLGDPQKVLNGMQSRVSTLSEKLRKKTDAARQMKLKEIKERAPYDKLLAEYKAAKSAEERAAIEPYLQEAEKAYNAASSDVMSSVVVWKGYDKDVTELAAAVRKRDAVAELISSGALKGAQPQPKRRLNAAEKEAAEARARNERRTRTAEAVTPAEAPETTGEALTRTEAAEARKPEKTVYQGKGVGVEDRASAEEARLLRDARQRQERGETLTPLEQFLIEQDNRSRKKETVDRRKKEERLAAVRAKDEAGEPLTAAEKKLLTDATREEQDALTQEDVSREEEIEKEIEEFSEEDAVGYGSPDVIALFGRARPTKSGKKPAAEEVEEEIRSAGTSKLARIAARRAEVASIDRQLSFIEANKNGPVENGVKTLSAKQQTAKDRAVARLQVLRTELDELEKQQLRAEVEALEKQRDVELSRGATANPSTTDSVRTELKTHFPDLGRVQVYDSVEALVKANPQYEGRIPDDARGFVDRAGNKAFLIAGNINQGQALSVLLHEVGAHIGMKNLLGDAQYNAFVNAVERWQKAPATSAEGRVARAAQARVEAAETPESQQRDELLAYAVEEAVNAGITPQTKSPLGQWLGRIVQRMEAAVRKFFGMEPKGISLRDLVNTAYGAAKVEMQPAVASAPAPQPAEAGEILFSRNLPTASRVASNLVGGQKGFVDKLRDNFLGMGVRTQYIDKLFPTEEALKRGGVSDKDAMQAMYYLRMYDQRMHFTSQAMTVGVPERVEKTRRDGTKEFLIEAKDGANLKQAFDILKRKAVVKEAGSADAANKLVTLYMAAIRGERVGYDTLNFGRAWASAEIARIEGELKSPKLSAEQRTNLTKRKDRLSKRLDSMPSPADIKAAKAEIDANPVLREAFNEVRDIYNQYNRDLLNFNVQTGAISRELANKLLQESDYIPYYRVRDGVAELLIGKETPIRIGNLKDSPHLQELVGGDEPVMDFITSSIQNTSMLIDMATHNLAMRNLMFEFRDVGLATIGKTKGGKAPEGAVTFKVDGVEHYGVVDTEMLGISSDLLVKGLAGIPTMFPTMIRVMGMPARFLRRLIVASPVYMARQLFRDSLGASIASGANTVPVLSALKQIGKTDVLEKRGITGGQVFTGMPEDMSQMIKDMQAGKISFNNGLAWLESKAAQADALTRRSQYESYLQQGLSEMEATYMALESMNFSRRGLSPSIHMASALIPFFNTQIQGLDVLYRSFRGKMPMNERLNVRRKLLVRGAMLFGLSFAYALAMQDDEAYKNAKPEDKYGNWFVPLDMFGIKEPLRLPIPFELGYFFKALPEAIVNIALNEKGAEEAQKALKHIGQQIVPGLSNYFIPQAVKPALEVAFGSSIYTGRDIEPAREQGVEPGYRTQSSTTELAKAVGEMTGFSPIKLEFLIRGYTGQMGMAAIAALSAPFAGAGEGPAPATKRYSDLPLIGTLFQPKDASGIVDLVYERMNKVRQAQETYERFISEGKQEKAAQYAKEKADELSLASVAGAFRQQMGEITDYERRVRASNLSPERKREELDRATQAKITLSKTVQAMSGRRTPQAAPA